MTTPRDDNNDDTNLTEQQLQDSNVTTQRPQQPTAGKTKRDDDGPVIQHVDDQSHSVIPLPEPQPQRDVTFTATVRHHVTAFVTWQRPEMSACSSDGVTPSDRTVVGYRLRYGNTESSTSTTMVLDSNVAAIDGLPPSAVYWYQLQYLFDDGSHSTWTDRQLLET